MRVLVYTEPQIEMDWPAHKGNWLSEWVPRLAQGLKAAYPSAEIVALGADHLVAGLASVAGVQYVAAGQSQVTDLLREGALQGRVERFRQGALAPTSRTQADRIARCLHPFKPDLVIALSDASFLRHAFPGAVILQHEYGLLSRPPFPEAFFFDPLGSAGTAWLNEHHRYVLEEWDPSPEQLSVATDLIRAYRSAILDANPFAEGISNAKQRYSRFALLPLQVSGHALYDGFTEVTSQLQLTLGVLESLPHDVGLFVTEHPGGKSLNPESRDYLRQRYPAFLQPQGQRWHLAPSQYLAPFCETIVSVSSTVAALTLFWGNAFIPLGDGYLDFLATRRDENLWPATSRLTQEQRERMLAWLIFDYLVVEQDIVDGGWMRSLVEQAAGGHRRGSFRDFYAGLKPKSVQEVRDRWVSTVQRNGYLTAFELLSERYAQAVNSGNKSWEAVERELQALSSRVHIPLTDARASYHFHRAMAEINLKQDPLTAAGSFAAAAADYAQLCAQRPDPQCMTMYWESAFHVAYALRLTSERSGFLQSLTVLFSPPSRQVGPMPPHLHARLGELL